MAPIENGAASCIKLSTAKPADGTREEYEGAGKVLKKSYIITCKSSRFLYQF